MAFEHIDPATGRAQGVYAEHGPDEVSGMLDRSVAAQQAWRQVPVGERAARVGTLTALLDERADGLARLMATEMGKPLAEGHSEVQKCAVLTRYCADEGAAALAPIVRSLDGNRAEVRHDPLGPVLAIMPWNFPIWQAVRCAAPALVAGNTVVLKHAPRVPGCAEALDALFRDADLPKGVFQNVRVDDDRALALVADPRIAGVALTGSTRAGRAVAAAAGEALKPSVLELGGSDPFVVLADADLAKAAERCVRSRMLNAGQSCIAAKRVIVEEAAAEAFMAHLRAALSALVVGDPTAPDTTVGPLARADLRDALHRQVRESVESGADAVLGGQLPPGDGFFYPVTLLENVGPGQPAWEQELFGPVMAVRRVADVDAALAAALDSSYALGSSIWTHNRQTAERFAQALGVGSVFINEMCRSDPRLPFGGNGQSGWGRELGALGFRAFVNTRTVVFTGSVGAVSGPG